MVPELDSEFVRTQFPAFSEPSLAGWAFFENAGGSYTCRQTIDRLIAFYRETKMQPYGPAPASTRGGQEMDEAYARLGEMLNVGQDAVHIGPSTSQNTYTLAQAFRPGWTTGDEIIVTNQDHEANSGVWRRLADTGITVREWTVDPHTGLLDQAGLTELLTDRTRLVAFPHCSNIIGHLNRVAEICALVAQAGAVSVVDGVSAAPHGFPDVAALGADIYLFSAYKTFGPHQGVMVVRRSVLDQLANQSHFFNDASVRKRLLPAGPDHAQIAACNGMVDYVDEVYAHHFGPDPVPTAERGRRVHDLFRQQETKLLEPLLETLSNRSDIRILGPTDPQQRVPTVAFVPEGDPARIAAELTRHRVMADSGNFYAVRLLEALGVPSDPGVVRLSFVHYTTAAEVDQAIDALSRVL